MFILQLQILVDDSARLQGCYPGGNADHILEQQNIVIDNWNTLQERAAQRKIELQASYQLQRFLASVRNFVLLHLARFHGRKIFILLYFID